MMYVQKFLNSLTISIYKICYILNAVKIKLISPYKDKNISNFSV